MVSNSFASKRYITFFSTSILALLLIAGCSKDDDNGDTNSNTDKISATINGQAWENSIDNTATTGGTIQLYAMKGDDTGIQIYLTEDTTGTFPFPSADATINYVEGHLDGSPVHWNNNISGSITVVDNNSNKVSGTFNTVSTSPFNSDTIVLQNGSFIWQRN